MLSGQISVTVSSDGGEYCWFWDDEFTSVSSQPSTSIGPVSTLFSPLDSLLVRAPDCVRRVASSNPGRSGGRIFSPELTLCADFYSVSVPPPCYRSGTKKTPVILPKVQVAGHT